MASPEVWLDAKPRVQAVADALGITVSWPNRETEEPEPSVPDGALPMWLNVEIEGEASEPIELGGETWDERGRLWVHVLIPTGEGIEDGLAVRKTVANAFRGLPPAPVRWQRFDFPPGGTDQTYGNWFRLSLGIAYRFQDR